MIKKILFSLPMISLVLVVLAIMVTELAPKDLTSDAWAYHYYSGSQLFENRLDTDYFAASTQGYFNPLVHAPFAAMVQAGWTDRLIAAVMACYGAIAFIVLAIFYKCVLGLVEWELWAAIVLSLTSLVVWMCAGTSTPDLFLQVPVLAGFLCLFYGRAIQSNPFFLLAGVFLGLALGLKLSAIVYVPTTGALLLYWCYKKYITWQWFLIFVCMVLVGFLVSYGWWGWQLYQHFGNPFFPFFNQWFHSPDYTTDAIQDRRFLLWDMFQQGLLPFRIATSEVFTYVEIIAPDLKPGLFVVMCITVLVARLIRKQKVNLTALQVEFLCFLFVSLYVWVFISGNGRYVIAILLLMGGALVILLRSFLSRPHFQIAIIVIILLQFLLIVNAGFFDGAFRMARTEWGGTWYTMSTGDAIRKNDQLILTDTKNPLSALVMDVGLHSSIINISGVNALKNNRTIQEKITHYEGRIVGVTEAIEPSLLLDSSWMNEFYFRRFGRFGLGIGDKTQCQIISMKGRDGVLHRALSVCPLVRKELAEQKYSEATWKVGQYYQLIEQACPEVFSPTSSAIEMLGEGAMRKFYSNYDMDVVMGKNGDVIAKRVFYMGGVSIGNLIDVESVSVDQWRHEYCASVKADRRPSL